jgi:hypothetical protein
MGSVELLLPTAMTSADLGCNRLAERSISRCETHGGLCDRLKDAQAELAHIGMCERPRQVISLLEPKQPRSCVWRSGLCLEPLGIEAEQDLDAVADLPGGLNWGHSPVEPGEQTRVMEVV